MPAAAPMRPSGASWQLMNDAATVAASSFCRAPPSRTAEARAPNKRRALASSSPSPSEGTQTSSSLSSSRARFFFVAFFLGAGFLVDCTWTMSVSPLARPTSFKVLSGPMSKAPPAGYAPSLINVTGLPPASRKLTLDILAPSCFAQAPTRSLSGVVVWRSSVTGPLGPRTRRRTDLGASGAGAARELAAGVASALVVGLVLVLTIFWL
mmetsp:Transcript_3956/g.9938  ORF Transcript_3956/g.9938 Transcript_3956/m.9938 type:complete len:209 (+) Transcript_3956:456-1082(+)